MFYRLRDLRAEYETKIEELYGARDVIDLILARTGEFVKWEDSRKVAEVLSRKICQNHLNDLLVEWKNKAKNHVYYKRKTNKKVCSVSVDLEDHENLHEDRNDPKNTVSYEDALSVFDKTAVLIHPGTRTFVIQKYSFRIVVF